MEARRLEREFVHLDAESLKYLDRPEASGPSHLYQPWAERVVRAPRFPPKNEKAPPQDGTCVGTFPW